jgi:hypothetical protein
MGSAIVVLLRLVFHIVSKSLPISYAIKVISKYIIRGNTL